MNAYRRWLETQPRYQVRHELQPDCPSFTKEFWKGLGYAILAAAVIAVCLVLMALVVAYGQQNNV